MQIVLALKETELLEAFSFCLNNRYTFNVVEATDEAIVQSSIQEDTQLIVVDSGEPSLIAPIANLKKATPPGIVVFKRPGHADPIATSFGSCKLLGTIQKENAIDELFKVVDNIPRPHTIGEKPPFDTILSHLLLSTTPLPADVFIQLNPKKHIKILKAGDVFDKADYEKYCIRKKQRHLYFKSDNFPDFIDSLRNKFSPTAGAKYQPKKEVFDEDEVVKSLASDSFLDDLALFQEGFPPPHQVQEIVKAAVRDAVKQMSKVESLKDILANLAANQGSYISAHSNMVGTVACAIAKGMDWKSDTTYSKLIMAGLLHDSTIKNQELAKIKSLSELETKKFDFSEDEVRMFKNHPFGASEMIKRFNEVPKDVDIIILQHHERPDGTGFPRGLTHAHIHPMSAVFIAAHDFVDYYFEMEDKSKFRVQDFFDKVVDIYTNGHFKKIYRSMQAYLKDPTADL